MKGSAEVVAAAWTYVPAMDKIQGWRKWSIWNASGGLTATHSFPGHIVPFLSNCLKDPSLFLIATHVSEVEKSEKWQGRVYKTEGETKFTVEDRASGVPFKKSLIDHLQAGTTSLQLGDLRRRVSLGTTVVIWCMGIWLE